MEKRKVIRRRIRKDKRIKRSIATVMMVIMLMAASISAVAFAVSSDYEADVVDYIEEAYVSAPAAEEAADADEVVVEDAVEADVSAIDEAADDIYEALTPEIMAADEVDEIEANYIEIEPLAGVDPSIHTVAIQVGAAPDATADTGFVDLIDAIIAANSGDTIYFLGNTSHTGSIPVNGNLTLDFRGYNLTTSALSVASGATLTVLNGGTLYAELDGVYAMDNSTVNFNGAIVAGHAGVRTAGSGASVTVNGDISGESAAVATEHGSTSTIVVTGNLKGGLDGIRAWGGGTITVNGNISADEGVSAGYGDALTINVLGNISAGWAGIFAMDNVTVNLVGDINAEGTGIDAFDNARVYVTGDITVAGDDSLGGVAAFDSAQIRIEGNISAYWSGIFAMDNATVNLVGNINAEGTGIDAFDNARVHITGDIVATGEWSEGVVVDDSAQVRVTGNITATIFVVVRGNDLTFADHDATSALEGYRQFSRGGATVWVLGSGQAGGPTPPTPPAPPTPTPPTPTPPVPAPPVETTPAPSTPGDSAETTAPAAGTGSTDTTPSADRRPAAGPQTGDTINWFTQIAVIAALVASFAAAGIYRTREQS